MGRLMGRPMGTLIFRSRLEQWHRGLADSNNRRSGPASSCRLGFILQTLSQISSVSRTQGLEQWKISSLMAWLTRLGFLAESASFSRLGFLSQFLSQTRLRHRVGFVTESAPSRRFGLLPDGHNHR